MEWRKFYTKKWIYGSIRLAKPEVRGTFADLMALAGESKMGDGTLRHDVGKPMNREWIASVLMIPIELLNATIKDGQKDKNVNDGRGRIEVWKDGTIELTNFKEYQDKPLKPKETKPPMSEQQAKGLTRKLASKYPESAEYGIRQASSDKLPKSGEG